jgi:transcriptional regulator with XRE-family HTH domain
MEVIMIRENRIKNGLTQEELAEKLDISWRHMQRLEYNEENTTVKTLKKVINVLNIPDEEILEYLKK